MARHEPPYRRALATLQALTAAPLQQGFNGPRALARSVGLAATSGYRAAAQAEAAGLLSRDADGVYGRGAEACRIGLSALGFGEFAAAAEPVLLRLRQSVRMTAFLGIVQDLDLRVGPFSMGRGAGFLTPEPRVVLGFPPIWAGDGPIAIGLTPIAQSGRRHTALVALLTEKDHAGTAVVGVLLPHGEARIDPDLSGHILTARDRFRQTSAPRG